MTTVDASPSRERLGRVVPTDGYFLAATDPAPDEGLRDVAWAEFRDGPNYTPTDRYPVRDAFDAGWTLAHQMGRTAPTPPSVAASDLPATAGDAASEGEAADDLRARVEELADEWDREGDPCGSGCLSGAESRLRDLLAPVHTDDTDAPDCRCSTPTHTGGGTCSKCDGFACEYADKGQTRCPSWRCDCFIETHPHDNPQGLHPEAFVVHADAGDEGVRLTEDEKSRLGKALFVAIERTQWEGDEHPIIPAVESILTTRLAEVEANADFLRSMRRAATEDWAREKARADAAEARLGEGVVEWGVLTAGIKEILDATYGSPSKTVRRFRRRLRELSATEVETPRRAFSVPAE